MKTLHLVLKHKWYDMIASGEKKEEYRAVTQYWMRRLIEDVYEYEEDACYRVCYADYDRVCFHRGYTSTTMTFIIESIDTGKGKPEWGAPTDRPVFIIKLGKRV